MRLLRRPSVLVLLAIASVSSAVAAPGSARAATPISHLVVIYDENVSFDHYFGTYPNAVNPAGEPSFTAAAGTPAVDGLSGPLLTANPNSANPSRLSRSQAMTCDQDHGYTDEQLAFDDGAMDKFVESVAGGGCADKSTVMDYFDGNTVTGLWNLAQHFSMSDGFRGTTFGPSTPGALNLIAGTTHGASPNSAGSVENGTVISDPDPAFDDCGHGGATMSGQNVGDLLSANGVTWGWFQGGFRRTAVGADGKATCGSSHRNIGGAQVTDYSAHHEPFQYFASTANPHHLPPGSVAAIGHNDQANHQYDLTDFDAAVGAGNLPAVSFLKAAAFEDGHAGYSDPLDEQAFVARALDEVEASPDWSSTAVLITYDDSDGWYDHSSSTILEPSSTARDAAICKHTAPAAGDYLDRCGPGPRLPLLVVSPWTRVNAVDSSPTEQASITKFIEDNWSLGRLGDQSFDARAGALDPLFDLVPGHARAPAVFLDPSTGAVASGAPAGFGASPDTRPPQPAPVVTPPAIAPPVAALAAPVVPARPTPPPTTVARPKLHPKLTLSGRRRGRKAIITFRVTQLLARGGRATLSAKLKWHGKTIARGSGTLRSGRVRLTLRSRSALRRGRYRLTITVRQGSASAVLRRSLSLR